MRSPKPRLDQTTTEEAIQEFQLFINMYPNSARVEESTRLMDELRDKLVFKSYLNAKLYYNLGDYLGNNYMSAVIAAQNSLKDFPDTKYREELSFLILESKHIQAVNSIEEKKEERVRDTIDEYYSFINEFPEGKFRKRADRIFKESDDLLKQYNNEVAVN
jgi:outer membrane protein assembly factor BamD